MYNYLDIYTGQEAAELENTQMYDVQVVHRLTQATFTSKMFIVIARWLGTTLLGLHPIPEYTLLSAWRRFAFDGVQSIQYYSGQHSPRDGDRCPRRVEKMTGKALQPVQEWSRVLLSCSIRCNTNMSVQLRVLRITRSDLP